MTRTRPQQRKYWREEDARAFVEEHAASGLSITAFADVRGISVSRLKRWRRRFGIRSAMPSSRGATDDASGPPDVVRIARVEREHDAPSVTSPSAEGAVLTIEVGRARVGVPAGFDAGTVHAVLDALLRASGGGTR